MGMVPRHAYRAGTTTGEGVELGNRKGPDQGFRGAGKIGENGKGGCMDLEGGFTPFPLQSTRPIPKRSFRRPPYMKKPYSGMGTVPRHPRVRIRVGMGMGWQGVACVSEEGTA
jgi:hypothetical protein